MIWGERSKRVKIGIISRPLGDTSVAIRMIFEPPERKLAKNKMEKEEGMVKVVDPFTISDWRYWFILYLYHTTAHTHIDHIVYKPCVNFRMIPDPAAKAELLIILERWERRICGLALFFSLLVSYKDLVHILLHIMTHTLSIIFSVNLSRWSITPGHSVGRWPLFLGFEKWRK